MGRRTPAPKFTQTDEIESQRNDTLGTTSERNKKKKKKKETNVLLSENSLILSHLFPNWYGNETLYCTAYLSNMNALKPGQNQDPQGYCFSCRSSMPRAPRCIPSNGYTVSNVRGGQHSLSERLFKKRIAVRTCRHSLGFFSQP